jgi:hypothetical protein
VNFGGNLLGIFLILHPGLLDSRISLIFFKWICAYKIKEQKSVWKRNAT